MKILSPLVISAALFATAMIPSLNATTLDLSEAKGFNLLTWGNATQPNSDIEGRAAIGGNASFSNFSIGNSIVSANLSDAALIVGGNLTVSNGSVKNGSVYVGGNEFGSMTTTAGTVTSTNLGAAVPFNFATAKSALSTKSATYGAALATGTSLLQYSTLTLTGSNADLNIFNISGTDLDAASTLSLNVTAGSHVLINVSGTSVNFDNAGLSGFTSDLTLFNFYQATSLTFSSVSMVGSILASSANVTYNNGNVNGELIANSFTGGGELHNSIFKNQKPPTNVPDTTSTALLGLFGLIGCGLFRRLSSNRR